LRRTFAIIPLFLAALLAQIYAPVGSSVAMGRAQGAGIAPICASEGGDAGAPHVPGVACDLCAFVLSGAAPLPPAAIPVVAHRPQSRRLAWALPEPPVFVAAWRKTAQARAPPFAS